MSRNTIPGLLLILLTTASFCHGDQKTVEVVGVTECSDCLQNNIKTSHAFKGLKVSIDCKNEAGEMKSRGFGDLDEEGKFRVEFPKELMESGRLKEECYAQLHSASDSLCPTMPSKIAYVSESDGKHTFSPLGSLKFSPKTCTNSAKFSFPHISFPFKFFYHKKPFYKEPFYKKPFPHIPIYKKPFYKKPFPSIPIYKKPFPHIPIYKKPLPPPIPIYKKTLPPFVPIYKKPLPQIPIYKKTFPPFVPIYKKPFPQIPIYKKTLPPFVPMYKKPFPQIPIYKKTLPPFVPIYKKPLPSIPIFEKPYKPLPKFPEFPPKFFPHP